jgi:hypothetical protein
LNDCGAPAGCFEPDGRSADRSKDRSGHRAGDGTFGEPEVSPKVPSFFLPGRVISYLAQALLDEDTREP